LFVVALDMVRGVSHASARGNEQDSVALAIYPLAIPKIAGPEAMLTVVLLTDDDRFNLRGQMVTVGRLALVLVIAFFLLLAAGPISRLIGTAGVSVISRIMGVLLAALAVTLVLTAMSDWLSLPKL
jgi:multiple antibiotic resistance protein